MPLSGGYVWCWTRGSYTFSGAPLLALVIDSRVSPNLTIKHRKKRNNNLFVIILPFQQYVAVILAPPLRIFHAPQEVRSQLKDPGVG